MSEKLTEDELSRLCDEQAATLERVRAVRSAGRHGVYVLRSELNAALAGQPETPKGQGAKPLPAREHARRRGSLDGADAQALEGALSQVERDLAAANARIADLEESERKACRLVREIAQERDDSQRRDLERLAAVAGARDVANARADAAEREHNETHTKLLEEIEACQKAETERDQLAAHLKRQDDRVKELLDHWPSGACTLEEWKVLEACASAPVNELEYHMFDGEGWKERLAEAELANRAAKAKRGDK